MAALVLLLGAIVLLLLPLIPNRTPEPQATAPEASSQVPASTGDLPSGPTTIPGLVSEPVTPPGLGAPVYGKLDADIAAALMGINAVKGVEIGDGFAAAALSGEDNADELRMGPGGRVLFGSNRAGGVLGGISTGQPVVARFAVKPTSSILQSRRTVDRSGADADIVTKGRHDPCVGIRAVPVGEAMVACVLADHFLRHRGQVG